MLRDCRGERIRTSDFFLPKEARYQAALHPDAVKNKSIGRNARSLADLIAIVRGWAESNRRHEP
jgi:hypothetical protein